MIKVVKRCKRVQKATVTGPLFLEDSVSIVSNMYRYFLVLRSSAEQASDPSVPILTNLSNNVGEMSQINHFNIDRGNIVMPSGFLLSPRSR